MNTVNIGININDSTVPWSELILTGRKTIETRNRNTLKPYIGKKVGIIRTGKGQAQLVGYMVLGEPKIYTTLEEFRKDEPFHQVSAGSEFDWSGIKYGYPVIEVERTEPKPITSRGMVVRKLENLKTFEEFTR